jgi:hypothetical protein
MNSNQSDYNKALAGFEYWRDVTAVNAAHEVLMGNGIDNFDMAVEITRKVLEVADAKWSEGNV